MNIIDIITIVCLVISFGVTYLLFARAKSIRKCVKLIMGHNVSFTTQDKLRVALLVSLFLMQLGYTGYFCFFLNEIESTMNDGVLDTIVHCACKVGFEIALFLCYFVTVERFKTFSMIPNQGRTYLILVLMTMFGVLITVLGTILGKKGIMKLLLSFFSCLVH